MEGLLGLAGEFGNSFLDSYRKERDYKDKKLAEEEAKILRKVEQDRLKKSFDADMFAKGLIQKEDGSFGYTDEKLADISLDRRMKEAGIRKTLSEASKERREAGLGGGKTLSASESVGLGGANASFDSLTQADELIKNNKDITGPAQGFLTRGQSYFQVGDTGRRGAALDAALKQRAQVIGKYLEGGKLTNEDLERYKEMLPNITDTQAVAEAKIQNLKKQIADKQAAEKLALGQAGYNVGNISTREAPSVGLLEKKPLAQIPGKMTREQKIQYLRDRGVAVK